MKQKSPQIAVELLSKLLSYDKETGDMVWLDRDPSMFTSRGQRDAAGCCANWNARYSGKPALAYIGKVGYKRGNIFDKGFLAHRVAMALILGHWDFDYVDHVDGNKLNNSADNLRACSNSENLCNRGMTKGRSASKGVFFNKKTNKWIASIMKDYKAKHIGCFDTETEAAMAYDAAAKVVHGEFARLNFATSNS